MEFVFASGNKIWINCDNPKRKISYGQPAKATAKPNSHDDKVIVKCSVSSSSKRACCIMIF